MSFRVRSNLWSGTSVCEGVALSWSEYLVSADPQRSEVDMRKALVIVARFAAAPSKVFVSPTRLPIAARNIPEIRCIDRAAFVSARVLLTDAVRLVDFASIAPGHCDRHRRRPMNVPASRPKREGTLRDRRQETL